MKTPVAFMIFKRPDTTQKVFEAIRQAKPPKLFVIADGPRGDRPGEAEKCEAVRAIIETVDWDCEVTLNYSDINLGCAKRVSSGLDWVFSNVEEAIILEDDCVPHPTFFPFCEQLLERYRYDTRIASISGQNVQFGRRQSDYSYYYSIYNHCWGWATWRRAWQYFDFDMKLWPMIKDKNLLEDILQNPEAVRLWKKNFQSVYDNQLDSWAVRWTFACWIQNSLGIISNGNLISNIGFGTDSTHFSTSKTSPYENMPMQVMKFPLEHPPFMIRDLRADKFTQKTLFKEDKVHLFKQRIKNILQEQLN